MDELLRGTAWLSLLSWAASEWTRTRGRPSAGGGRARLLFTVGGFWLAVHSVLAFHIRHHWSHEHALADTARRTEAVTGLATGAGLFVNYLMILLWLAEIAWWWLWPDRRRARARALDLSLRGFFLFMFVNGSVVFASGVGRWVGAAAVLAVVAAWYRGAGALEREWPKPERTRFD
jgi:hypothetical protein